MMVYSLFYYALAWYIEKVMPGEYGVALPFYFPFMVCLRICKKINNLIFDNFFKPSFWRKNKLMRFDGAISSPNNSEKSFFEPEDPNVRPSIQIKNISKVYARN